ncbi:elongation factor tu GTP binding domain-containing protein [Ditylenchus destructor]|nr:elongation factor tu GTP binding domain-containing protein [Ditylenchus destructor]
MKSPTYRWFLRSISVGAFYMAFARALDLSPFSSFANPRDDNSLKEAQASTNQIRNVCIVAHVDHGKTTLADYLISSNGIISARLAGTLRYMDSREDEQTRGITMKSSAISLLYEPLLVNLIDSPGHVDFESEVSSAINLADIALLLVDVVEGVCSQTESLLRQSINYKLDVVLVINKIDRVIVELKMTPPEVFKHIQRLIEHVNSCLSQILRGQFLEEEWGKVENAEKLLYFDPSKGNVLFASAIYGYAFSLDDFAALWAKKMEVDQRQLSSLLFSFDHYYSPKTKEILPEAEVKGKKTLFEQLVLEPIFELHRCALVDKDLEKLKMLSTKLGFKQLRGRRVDEAFTELMRQWMPMTNAVITACCRMKSSAKAFQDNDRLLRICESLENPYCEHLRNASANDDLCLVYAAKFFKLESRKVALARVMCGTLKTGDKFTVMDSAKSGNSVKESVTVKNVYIILGRELVVVPKAPAGRICAIESEGGGWFEGHILISTMDKDFQNWPLHFDFSRDMEPLVRVIIQPNTTGVEEWAELKECLRQLVVLDRAVKVVEQDNGDLALVTAGEIHLQKCLKDLADLGQTDVSVSSPIVPFLETIIPDTSAQVNLTKLLEQYITECLIKSYSVKIRLKAAPLPDEIVKLLYSHTEAIDSLRKSDPVCESKIRCLYNEFLSACKAILPKYRGTIWYRKSESDITALVDRIWSFGPSRARANILINCVEDYDRPSVWRSETSNKRYRAADRAVLAGFDLAMAHVAAMYKLLVQTSEQALGKAQTVLAQRRAKVIGEEVNEMSGLFEITAYMPVVESFSFCEQLRKGTSGLASAQMEFSHWQLIDEDPFWQPTTEDEIEEYGIKGDSINQARLYMDAVKRRKGLPIDEVIIVSAEKQRNLKRNK